MQNLEYSRESKYSTSRNVYVDGNTVRKIVPEEMPARVRKTNPARHDSPAMPRKATKKTPKKGAQKQTTKYAARLRARKAAQRTRMFTYAGIATVFVVFLVLFFFIISGVVENNELTSDISGLETKYSQLQAQNDAYEYDIDNTVSVDTVIKVATEELGMVRATNDQIVNYESGDGEYIQQVAQIPVN